MLTLNFASELTLDSGYVEHYELNNLTSTQIKFSTLACDLPYIITAHPSALKGDLLYYSPREPFSRRGVNMIKLKEIVDSSPVLLRVKFLSSYYFVGKGFIARIDSQHYPHIKKIELLFVVAAERGKAVNSPHDLRIYLNREMYEPQYKRIMSILKPYMAEHKGDIIVTRSINDYFLYQFKLPKFTEMEERLKFDDNIKEFFFRSIKWSKWRKDEDIRIAEAERMRELVRAKKERELGLQNAILEILQAEELRLNPPNPVIELEAVEELPVGEELRRMQAIVEDYLEMEASMREEMGVDSRRSGEIPLTSDRQSHIHREQSQPSQFQPQDLQQEPLSHGVQQQPEAIISPLEQEQLSEQQETMALGTQDLQENPELLENQSEPQTQPQYHPDAVPMTEEEMLRIMNQFSIAQPTEVQYSVRTDPATGIVIPTVEEIQEMEIDEDTEVLLQEDDDVEQPTEDDLDNDPDQYEDAIIVDDSPSRERVFSAMEGGTDGG